MAPISKDEHILLLFACIKNSRGPGQVDWNGVATDTQLTSNAVAKRFNKLAKDYGVRGVLRGGTGRVSAAGTKNRPEHEEGEQGDSQEDSSGAKGKGGQKGGKGRASKKRKISKVASTSDDESDGDNEQVDYDAQDVVAGEQEEIKPELDGDDEVSCFGFRTNTAALTDFVTRLSLDRRLQLPRRPF
ncbi:hypothetical protein D6D03_03536 [Aureobasidium pullulans]|nr:hypothetical protein D6D03_03536 [Aureobasidium pullulans]